MRASASLLLLAAIFCCGVTVASDQGYSGPTCLGSFCITKDLSARKLWRQLGTPARRPAEFSPYCFQAADKKRFLYVMMLHDGSDRIGEALVSDFPNCLHLPQNSTQADLGAWKTTEGIGIGDSEKDVLSIYGKPSAVDLGVSYQRRFLQGWLLSDKLPRMGDKAFFYRNNGTYDDLSAAEFGIRDGKVSFIWLSYDE